MSSINILDSEWKIIYQTKKQNKHFSDLDGYTDFSVKKIYIRIFEKGEFDIESIASEKRSTLRHEILHAFLAECGLRYNSDGTKSWATNEEMIDWFAIQYPKIKAIYRKLRIEE